MIDTTKIANKAAELGLGDISMHVWAACCKRHGMGGTPLANAMYVRIMKAVLFEYKEADERFAQFYAKYPRHIARKNAEKAWAKLKVDDMLFEQIMQALEKALVQPQWQKKEYIPYAATWLNGERWNDEVDTSTVPSDSKYNGI